jgi:carboxypeptidase D
VKLAGFAIGDGAIGDFFEFDEISTVQSLETWPQLIGFDPVVADYFKSQLSHNRRAVSRKLTLCRAHLCGFDINLTYPQEGTIPGLGIDIFTGLPKGSRGVSTRSLKSRHNKSVLRAALLRYDSLFQSSKGVSRRDDLFKKNTLTSRSLAGRANGTIDPWYDCFTLNML